MYTELLFMISELEAAKCSCIMYKKLITSLLVVAFLNLVGCYSFQDLSREEQEPDFPLEQYPIILFLNDADAINSDAYHHTIVRQPSNYIVGSGLKYQGTSKIGSKFKGKILRHQIDSSKAGVRYFIYWLNDDSRVLFEKGNYIDITPESEEGFWIAVNEGYEKINSDEINNIEMEKLDTGTTIVFAIFFVGIAIALTAFAAFGSRVGG